MDNQKFIARNEVFDKIKEIILLNDQKSHFISLVGKGGTGKTTLLYNLMQEFENSNYSQKILVVNFDYRDLIGQSTLGTFIYVVQKLLSQYEGIFSKNQFLEFISLLLTKQVTLPELQQFAEVNLAKLKNEDIRIVLLEDTLEIIKAPSSYIHTAFSVGALIPNCVAIVACRPEDNALENLSSIRTILDEKNWVIHEPFELPPFSFLETKEFFGESLPYDLQEKIHYLTQGSPIHLAITLEILKHNDYLPIFNKSIDELKIEYEKDSENLFRIFEYELLGRMSKLETYFDWALLTLSYLNRRYDKKILKLFLDLNENDLDDLEEKIKSLSFLRKSTMPNRYHKELLHDEMQRMINENLWDEIDFDGSQRKMLAKKVAYEYYVPEIEDRKNKLVHLESNLNDFENIIKYWELTIDLIELQNECLDYLFRISKKMADNYFIALAEDTKNNKLGILAKRLLHDGVQNIDLSNTLSYSYLIYTIYKI